MFETCNSMYFQTKYMFKTHPKYFPAQKKKKKSVLEAPKGKTNIYT
jgi:hypothetical protein